MYLTDLDKAAKLSGLRVVRVPGWKTRGRPGPFYPRAVTAHHTGDTLNKIKSAILRTPRELAYANGTLRAGFSTLPGPLCQIGLGRDGTVYIIAAGRANHAGSVRNIRSIKAGDGNTQMVGIEAMNSAFEGWNELQINAFYRLCAALCEYYNWPRNAVYGHGEVSTAGKWDPGYNGKMIDMKEFRKNVEKVFAGENVTRHTATYVVNIDLPCYGRWDPRVDAEHKTKSRKRGFKIKTVGKVPGWVVSTGGAWYKVSSLKRVG